MSQSIYQLEQVDALQGIDGNMVQASSCHLPHIVDWMEAFMKESPRANRPHKTGLAGC